MHDNDADLVAFLARHADELRGIVAYSQRQWGHEDLPSEAFVARADISGKLGRTLDLNDPDDACLLLKRLRSLARRAGGVLRNASRPDQASRDDESGERSWDRYVIGDSEDAPSLLEKIESPEAPEQAPIDPYYSESTAWLWLRHRFNHSTREIAAFLLISASWCRQRRKRAQRRLETQLQLPHRLQTGDDDSAIQPWRKFKLPARTKTDDGQLALDFCHTPLQPKRGQLWLL